jgi:hypothetical protein
MFHDFMARFRNDLATRHEIHQHTLSVMRVDSDPAAIALQPSTLTIVIHEMGGNKKVDIALNLFRKCLSILYYLFMRFY